MRKPSDRELVERYRKGDVEAFDILVERYEKPLFSFIYRLIGNKTTAEDIFQEVFTRVIKSIPRYRHQKRFANWLYRIANNLIIDTLRKQKKEKIISWETKLKQSSGESLQLKDIIPDKRYLPDRHLETEEMRKKLEEAIELLPFEQRQVFMLREYSQLPFKEISSLLNCPLNTVLGRMHYALKNLRRRLSGEYEGQKR